jgi:hypothetical protein
MRQDSLAHPSMFHDAPVASDMWLRSNLQMFRLNVVVVVSPKHGAK